MCFIQVGRRVYTSLRQEVYLTSDSDSNTLYHRLEKLYNTGDVDMDLPSQPMIDADVYSRWQKM